MNREKSEWLPPAILPSLASDQVHIWRLSLAESPAQIDRYRHLLSADELERAQRFVFARDRRRYIMARGALRTLLGAYLDVYAREIVFEYGKHGKPHLSRPADVADLRFNLSHAHELAVYGFTRQRRIGIDIEYQRPLRDMAQLAASVFSAREIAVFDALPGHLQLPAFYAGWTRKEAFIKAIGDGLSYPLDRFDVSLGPGEPAQLLAIRGEAHSHRCWTMDSFVPAAAYDGAVVVENEDIELSFQRFAFDPLHGQG